MKKKLKIIIPGFLAITVALAVPHLRSQGGCSCHAPLLLFGSLLGCSDSKQPHSDPIASAADAGQPSANALSNKNIIQAEHKVTFIEIGSVNCIPCKMMQPIMQSVETQFGAQVKIVFYDVWTPQGKADAMKYGIRIIPTQVFLDSQGNEYYRHMGFFPKDELIKVLAMKGVR